MPATVGVNESALPAQARPRHRSARPPHRPSLLAQVHLDLIDQHTCAVEELTARIEVVIEPFQAVRDLLVPIPGVSTTVADVIIAETGADMTHFPTAAHLASWAGTCPGSNESAGLVKSTHTRPGNPYLTGSLGIAAMSAARSKDTLSPASVMGPA